MAVTSCKKDDNPASSAPTLSNNIQQGKWRISSYINSGNDETSHYTGYEFQFNPNGSVTAVNSTTSVSGTWSYGSDDSTVKLILGFTTSPFTELSDDWHVIQHTTSIIQLIDESGGNGGTDYLTFQLIQQRIQDYRKSL